MVTSEERAMSVLIVYISSAEPGADVSATAGTGLGALPLLSHRGRQLCLLYLGHEPEVLLMEAAGVSALWGVFCWVWPVTYKPTAPSNPAGVALMGEP